MRDLMTILENAYTSSAIGIADNMARQAIRDSVTDGASPAKTYGSDQGKVVVTAAYADGEVTVAWTLADQPSNREAAIVAIATRMQSRFG